jgi:hypothetical protein
MACFKCSYAVVKETREESTGSKKIFRLTKNLTMPAHEVNFLLKSLDVVTPKENRGNKEAFGGVITREALTKKWCRPYPRAVVLKYVPAIKVQWCRRLRPAGQGAGGPHILGVSHLPFENAFFLCEYIRVLIGSLVAEYPNINEGNLHASA